MHSAFKTSTLSQMMEASQTSYRLIMYQIVQHAGRVRFPMILSLRIVMIQMSVLLALLQHVVSLTTMGLWYRWVYATRVLKIPVYR
tara:strand:- start:383 stop:640 length:258 start_codon:yes stop_codon:yes gene_type:complete